VDESGTIEQEPIRLDREWNDAEVRCDLATLDCILADEFISTWLDGTLETKAKVLDDFRSGDVNFESIICDDYRVRVYGDTVVMNHRTVLKGQYKSEDFGMTYRTTVVWLKRDGRWQVVASQITRMAP
jgi:ketosteroid isomerase-like protein